MADPSSTSSRRLRSPAIGIASIVGVISIILVVRIALSPVHVEAEWTMEIRSPSGPADVYLGDALVGVTPLDLVVSPDDPQVTKILDVQKMKLSSSALLEVLGYQLETLGPPSALPPGSVHGGLAGGIPMHGHPDDPMIHLTWFKEIVRRPDRSLELVHPIFIEDQVQHTAYAFLLRFRRGAELAPDLVASQRLIPKHWLRRAVLREAEYRFTPTLTLGPAHDLDQLEEKHGKSEWWLERIPPGTERLDDDSRRVGEGD